MSELLEDLLQFPPFINQPDVDVAASTLSGSIPLPRPTRPTLSGLQWLAVPSSCQNLAYRIANGGTELQALKFGDNNGQIQVTASTTLSQSTSIAVNITTSYDGRLVVVALNDGSLRCYDSTLGSLNLRWNLPGAHSHNNTVSSADNGLLVVPLVSTSRSNAGSCAGPIRSLQFAPNSYVVALVDDNYENQGQEIGGLSIYKANVVDGTQACQYRLTHLHVSCASWCPLTNSENGGNDGNNSNKRVLAVGTTDGSINFYSYDDENADILLSPISHVPFVGEREESDTQIWSCAHLDWIAREHLAAGYARIELEDEEEDNNDPDDEDEDDVHVHEAQLVMIQLVSTDENNTKFSVQHCTPMGDVVSFFGVPKYGRHVYFTTSWWRNNNTNNTNDGASDDDDDDDTITPSILVWVTSNVGTDIAVLAMNNRGENNNNWQLLELPEETALVTPTNEDDEFVYPVGLNIVHVSTNEDDGLPTSSFPVLLLACTDGSLCSYRVTNQDDESMFITTTTSDSEQTISSQELLPASPVEAAASSAPVTTTTTSKSSSTTTPTRTASITTTDSGVEASLTPTTINKASAATAFGGGSSSVGGNSGVFGSAFGGSSGGLQGTTSTTATTFGSLSASSKTSPAFGGGGFSFGGGGSSSTPSPFTSFGGGSSSSVAPSPFGAPSQQQQQQQTTPAEKEKEVQPDTKQEEEEDAPTTTSTSVVGSGTTTPAFGSGGSGGLTFGSGTAAPSFSFSAAAAAAKPAGSTAFGGGSSSSGFSFGKTATLGGGSSGQQASPFNIFESNKTGSPTASMAKPLFGSSSNKTPSPPSETKEDSSNKKDEPKPSDTSTAAAAAATPIIATAEESKSSAPAPEPTATASSKANAAAKVFDGLDNDGSGRLPAAALEDLLDQLGEGFYGDELDNQRAKIDKGTGVITRQAFIDWYDHLGEDHDDDDSDDEEERKEEEENAREAFMKIAVKQDGSGGQYAIDSSQFEELFESMGSTYCEEVHSKVVRKLEKNGKIFCDDFATWYVSYLFDEGDEEYEEEESEPTPASANEGKTSTSSSPTVGWGDTFKKKEDSWKCEVCMVSNKKADVKCAACETPRPGFEDAAAPASSASSPAAAAGSLSGIGPKGFSFGVAPTDTATAAGTMATSKPTGFSGGFSFGAPDASSKVATSASGITFGAPDASSSTTKTPITFGFGSPSTKETAPGIQDDGKNSSAAAKTASRVFDALDKGKTGKLPASEMENLLDELGEGFHGEELDAQLAKIDKDGTGEITRQSFINWYDSLGEKKDEDDESDDEEERKEEEETARLAFMKMAKQENGQEVISSSDFADLFESMGSTYCEEVHSKVVKRLEKNGKIYLDDFTNWYVSYIFDDDDEEEDGLEGEQELATGHGGKTSSSTTTTTGWGDTFKKDTDSWKCEVCMVTNKKDAKKCAACETPRPGCEGAPSEDSGSLETKSGTEGFKFGAPATTPSTGTPLFGSTASTSAGFSGGFSFRDASKPAVSTFGDSSASKTTPSFGFGSSATPVKSTPKPKEKVTPEKEPGPSAIPTKSKEAEAAPAPSTTTKSSAAYPPLQATAPKPFSFGKGTTTTSKPEAATTAPAPAPPTTTKSSAAYPPLQATAPKPFSFGSGAGTPKPTATSPAPASSTATKSSAAYPPLQATAPKPFSFGGGTETAKPAAPAASATTKSSAAGYPPLQATAPKPFSFGGGTTAVPKPVAAPAAPAAAAAAATKSSAAYPPLQATAPKPFSFGGGTETSKPMAPAASTTTKSSASSAAGYPPLQATAPKPFSFGGGTATASKPAATAPTPSSTKSSAGYPPLQATAPKPFSFGGGTTTPKPAVTAPPSSKSPSPATSSATPPPSSSSEKMSDCARHFASLTKKLQETLKLLLLQSSVTEDEISQADIESHVDNIQSVLVSLAQLDSSMTQCKECTASILRVKSESNRQQLESRRLVDLMLENNISAQEDFVRQQPLDAISEERRRQLIAKAMLADRYVRLLRGRAAVFEHLGGEDGERAVLLAVLETFREVKRFKEETCRLTTKVSNLVDAKKNNTTRSRRLPVLSGRNQDTQHAGAITDYNSAHKQSQRTIGEKWSEVESAFQKLKPATTATFNFDSTIADGLCSPELKPQRRQLLKSTPITSAPRPKPFFSPPSQLKYRADWDKLSSVDQTKVRKTTSFVPPHELKQTTFSEASREALAPLGTTPDRVKDLLNTTKQGVTPPKVKPSIPKKATQESGARTPTRGPPPPMPAQSPSLEKVDLPQQKTGASSFVNPPLKSKDSSDKLKESSKVEATTASAGFSGIPGFGQPQAGGKAEGKISDSFTGTGVMSGKVPQETDGKAQKAKVSDSFLGMSGLGNSLFSPGNLPSSSQPFGESKPPQAPSLSDSPDFNGILTKFYQTHNPSKVVEVGRTLEKYKGREPEMFEKLAKKYRVPNPLDASRKGMVAATPPPIGMSSPPPPSFSLDSGKPTAALGSAPSPFAAKTPAPSTGASPFTSSAATSSPAPFVTASASTSTPAAPSFGMAATSSASPFGQSPAAAPAPTTPFSTGMMSSPSPFGGPQSQPPPSTPAPAAGPSPSFGGRQPRDILSQFYQQYNPSKVAEVDRLLAKYQGKEDQLFRNLAKKYNLDPSMFGLSSAATPSTFGGTPGGGFGGPSPSSAPGPSGFGQPSSLGGGSAFGGGIGGGSSFGQSPPTTMGSSSGFGQTSTLGGSAFGGGAAPATTPSPSAFGSASGGTGFGGQSSTGGPSFGALAHSPGGFGGGFNSPAPAAPFGTATPFGAPRR